MKQAKGILGKDVSGKCLGVPRDPAFPSFLALNSSPQSPSTINTPAARLLCLDAKFRALSSVPRRRLDPRSWEFKET